MKCKDCNCADPFCWKIPVQSRDALDLKGKPNNRGVDYTAQFEGHYPEERYPGGVFCRKEGVNFNAFTGLTKCPSCEDRLPSEGDYLCHECRWGI